MSNFYTILIPVTDELTRFQATVSRAQNFVDALNKENSYGVFNLSHKNIAVKNLSQRSELSVTESNNGQPEHKSSVRIEFDMEFNPSVHVDVLFKTESKPVVAVRSPSDSPEREFYKIFDYDVTVWDIVEGVEYCIAQLHKFSNKVV